MRTRVGYAGGATTDPTYHDLADHTEVFQIDYDPTRLSYRELIDEIWKNRRGGRGYGTQYMEAVFAENAEQADIAASRGVTAPILIGKPFYLAEDYHQKYYLRHDNVLMRELAAYSPAQFVDSTVAARLNGYVSRRGSADQSVIEQLGLSPQATEYLLRRCA